MSQKNTATSGTGLLNMVLNKSFEFLKWVGGTFLPMVGKFLWGKSLVLSDFLLEVIESARTNPVHPLWKRSWRQIFSAFIFIIILVLLAFLINKFW